MKTLLFLILIFGLLFVGVAHGSVRMPTNTGDVESEIIVPHPSVVEHNAEWAEQIRTGDYPF